MIQRCTNPNNTAYARYGGAGIKVCKRWRESFVAFLSDMGRKPAAAHSIERIDGKGHYEPGNCVWATVAEQNRNQQRTHTLTIDGVSRCLQDWSKVAGISPQGISYRLKHGMDPKQAVMTPTVQLGNARVVDLKGLARGGNHARRRAA